MILAPHFVSGAAIAHLTTDPKLLILLAIAVHLILDTIPHWDYTKNFRELKKKKHLVMVDALAGPIIVLYLLFFTDNQNILWYFLGGVIANVPDGLTLLKLKYSKNKILNSFFKFHQKLHIVRNPSWKVGIPPQILVILISIAIILAC